MASPEPRNPFFGAPVVFRESTETTMEDARELFRRGYPPGTVAAAGFQTGGRGRTAGRSWASAPGESLLFTLQLDPSLFPFSPTLFPLLTGLGIARYCESLGLSPRIKWPNDVLVDGAKLAGILCESTGGRLFAGIGLNCLQREFPEGLRTRATSLFLCGAADRKPLERLTPILEELRIAYGIVDWNGEIAARLYRAGDMILFREGNAEAPVDFIGVLEGIGADGELLLRENGTGSLKSFFSGEIDADR